MKSSYQICCSFILLVALVAASSCASQRTFQTTAPTGGLGKYIIIEIGDFKTALGYVPPDTLWRLPNEISNKLTREKLFTGVSRSPVNLSQNVLVMQGTIVNFTPAKWYEQAVRTTTIALHVRFFDKAENKLVAEATFEASSKAGAISGGLPVVHLRLVDEVVRYMRVNYASGY
ncbi:MAG: hypothetical protein ACT4NX_09795 [Deltaproteobacteria bacterium]